MHVQAATTLTPQAITNRFSQIGRPDTRAARPPRRLMYAHDRTPPKFFLLRRSVTPAPSAEVSVKERPGGAEVVLRLMWGPLPAPFPRALAALSSLCGLLIVFLSSQTPGAYALGSALILLPLAALFHQRQGELELQAQLSQLLDGVTFTPSPH